MHCCCLVIVPFLQRTWSRNSHRIITMYTHSVCGVAFCIARLLGEYGRMSTSVAAPLIHHMHTHTHPMETISTPHHPSTYAPTFTHTLSQPIVKWRVELLYRWCGTRLIRLTDVPPALRTITACVAVLHPSFVGWRPILEDP